MKRTFILLSMVAVMVLASASSAHSQRFINKLKKKTENKLLEKAFDEKKDSQEAEQQGNANDPNQTSMTNKRGSGLSSAPPDVKTNLADAEVNFKNKEYSKTRYSIRQAIIGIEMEIGQLVLDDLPREIVGLSMISDLDNVTSSSIGLVGLTIERVYRGDDQEFKITIGNEGLLPATVNIYEGTATYETSTDQNQKQIVYKGYNSLIEYDDYEGYKLSVPFGQSSVMVLNGINFAGENEFMDAANEINIENIKQKLGEK
jgi:hypothetical protein